jgi:KRAB domain-containing zinc finger protein
MMHERVHTGEKPYACQEEGCMKSYRLKSRLNTHIKLSHVETKLICQVCGKAFITARQLNEHTNLHTGEKPHKCHKCSLRFSLKASMVG